MGRLGSQLPKIEEDQELQTRWTPQSDVFQDHVRMKSFKEREGILEKIAERWFLLTLKAKFAGMGVIPNSWSVHIYLTSVL